MVKNKKMLLILSCLFVIFELLLGVVRETREIEHFNEFSFFIIVFACLFCVLFVDKTKEYLLTQAALLLTVAADYYLVLIEPRQQVPAMIFFSGTQICYFLRVFLGDENKKRRRSHLIVRTVLSAVAIAVPFIVLGENADLLSVISVFYYANLLTNIIFSFAQFKKLPLLAIGLVLFLCCDTLIGLDIMFDSYVRIRSRTLLDILMHPGFDLAWACYIPSQALLSISLLPERFKRK
ncbi:MAG: hypothetical protein IJN75_03735 [Clostridia bacterium]|nr:hypothetical protein [Clostridia bacterium]